MGLKHNVSGRSSTQSNKVPLLRVTVQTRSRGVFVFVCCFETMPHYLVVVVLGLNLQTRLVLTHRDLPASAPSAGI